MGAAAEKLSPRDWLLRLAEARLADLERQAVVDALRNAKGNKSRAAARLGLTRSQLYTRMKRHGLED